MWILTPLLLSAVSLTVCASNSGLEASVAFTAISVSGFLDVAFAALPRLFDAAIEVKISVDQIQDFIKDSDKAQPRKIQILLPSKMPLLCRYPRTVKMWFSANLA